MALGCGSGATRFGAGVQDAGAIRAVSGDWCWVPESVPESVVNCFLDVVLCQNRSRILHNKRCPIITKNIFTTWLSLLHCPHS